MSSAAAGGLSAVHSDNGRQRLEGTTRHRVRIDEDHVNTPFESAIRLRRVVKRFGALTAVDGLDLDVPYGTCVGLLGPNGAGKSTTMKLLTAQVIADEGELDVLGYQIGRASCRERV